MRRLPVYGKDELLWRVVYVAGIRILGLGDARDEEKKKRAHLQFNYPKLEPRVPLFSRSQGAYHARQLAAIGAQALNGGDSIKRWQLRYVGLIIYTKVRNKSIQ